jgi:RNA polymerase sigma-70 factor (ECF subfamily)
MPRRLTEQISARDSDTAAWLSNLAAAGTRREDAVRQLHALLTRAARREAGRRAIGSPVTGVELADLAQQAADDALTAILAKLGEFRGESRFTTWAYKFVVLEVASKLTRHTWRTRPTVPGDEAWGQLPDRFGFGPEEVVERLELLRAIRVAVETELTARQRRVFVALVLNGVPLDVLAAELSTSRNTLYKTLFDARRKLRAHLVANGYTEYE